MAGPIGFSKAHRLIGFEFFLRYPAGISVIERNLSLLLAQGGNAKIFEAFVDPVPDSDGLFRAGALDLNSNTEGNAGDVGPGALARLRLESLPWVAAGVGTLRLERLDDGELGILAIDAQALAIGAGNMVDTDGDFVVDSVTQVGQLAIDVPCPTEPVPLITPWPVATPARAR